MINQNQMSLAQTAITLTRIPVSKPTPIRSPTETEREVARPEAEVAVTLAESGPGKEGEGGTGAASPAAPPSPPLLAPRPTPPVGSDVYTPAPAQNIVVTALKEQALYLATTIAGLHEVLCPWSSDHDGDAAPAIYSEPDATHALGSFRCPYAHELRPRIGDLLEQLGVADAYARGKPMIRLVPGELGRVAEAAEMALASSGGHYQAGGVIVSINVDHITGDIKTVPLSEQALTKALSTGADFFWSSNGGWVRTDPPTRVVALVHKGQSYDHLPTLNGLARQPYFRKRDWGLVSTPGYDAATGVYGVFDPDDFPIPEFTEAAAREALAAMKQLVEEFHFNGPADRAAALCAMLTAAVRSSLPVAPAFNISASSPGSGKSYLGALLAPFAGPGEPSNVSYPTTSEEATKLVTSTMLTKPAVVLFDDMQTDWIPHSALNRMLTSETVTERMLGSNKMVTVSTAALIVGTGNNVSPVRDMNRRVVTISLVPQTASPATLAYNGNPVAAVRKGRGRYVAMALTIVGAWEKAGRPKADVLPIASFDEWSDRCRHPLLWLGEPDPAQSLLDQLTDDPDAETLGLFLHAWHTAFGSKPTMVREVLGRAGGYNDSGLSDALDDLPIKDAREISPSRLGWYLRKNTNRVANGLMLSKAPHKERNAWSVKPVQDIAQAPPSDPQSAPNDRAAA